MTHAGAFVALEARLAHLEAAHAVRRVAAHYFRLCDTLGPDTPMAELGELFARDAVWEGRGHYRNAFGRHDGRAAIVAMLGRYARPAHFALNAHYLASEDIVVAGDGTASAQWMMLQVSTYQDGRSDFRSAALNLDFAVEDGAWRITRFVTDAIFCREVAPWNDEMPISVPADPAARPENEDSQ